MNCNTIITEPDSAVSAFEASSAILLKVCRVGPKPGDLRAERNFRLVVRNLNSLLQNIYHIALSHLACTTIIAKCLRCDCHPCL